MAQKIESQPMQMGHVPRPVAAADATAVLSQADTQHPGAGLFKAPVRAGGIAGASGSRLEMKYRIAWAVRV